MIHRIVPIFSAIHVDIPAFPHSRHHSMPLKLESTDTFKGQEYPTCRRRLRGFAFHIRIKRAILLKPGADFMLQCGVNQ